MNRKSVSFAHLKQVSTPTSQISQQFPLFFTQQDLLVKEANIRNNIDKKEEGGQGKKKALPEIQTFVTLKGKTDTNGKPFERLKQMDDEWLMNGP